MQGSLYMTVFGAGKIPLMTTAIYLGNFLKGKAKHYVKKMIPVVVVIIGFLFILRGFGLGIPYISPKSVPQEENASYNYDPVSEENILSVYKFIHIRFRKTKYVFLPTSENKKLWI